MGKQKEQMVFTECHYNIVSLFNYYICWCSILFGQFFKFSYGNIYLTEGPLLNTFGIAGWMCDSSVYNNP